MPELRLVFQATDPGMTVRVDLSGSDGSNLSGAAPQLFAFHLTPEEYADLRWYLEEYMDLPIGGSVLRAPTASQVPSATGAVDCPVPSLITATSAT